LKHAWWERKKMSVNIKKINRTELTATEGGDSVTLTIEGLHVEVVTTRRAGPGETLSYRVGLPASTARELFSAALIAIDEAEGKG
tara:strand:+ start:425 stop:679 length:255 start_codon:yes stop_codon:yes gene_type:complete